MIKNKFLIIILFLMLLIPLRTDAARLELIHEDSFFDAFSEDQLLIPSYNDLGKVDGHLICQFDNMKRNASADMHCLKYDLQNNILWSKMVIPKENLIYENIDENIDDYGIVVNGANDIIIAKMSDDLEETEPEWFAHYGGNGMEMVFSFINSYNNSGIHDGYIAFVITDSTDIENIKPGYVIIKYDLNGQKVWEKNINDISNLLIGKSNNDETFAVILTENLLIKGKENENGAFSDFEHELPMYGNKIILSKNSGNEIDGIIVVGTESSFLLNPNDPFHLNSSSNEDFDDNQYLTNAVIAKYDLDGNEIWKKQYNPMTIAVFNDVILSKTPTGEVDGYIVIGTQIQKRYKRVLDNLISSYSNMDTVGVVQKYDLNGNLVWNDIYEYDNTMTSFSSITENYDLNGIFNGYVITGKKSEHSEENESVMFNSSIKKIVPSKLEASEVGTIVEYNTEIFLLKYAYRNYSIEKEVEKGGKLDVNTDAFPGEIVTLDLNIEDGYLLEKMIVLDENGKELEITNNTFVMPEGKVIIKATFKRLTNPETASIGYTIVFIILITCIATFIVKNQKIQEMC